MVLAGEATTCVPSGSVPASRLIESVVLRVMITASSSRALTKRRIDSARPRRRRSRPAT